MLAKYAFLFGYSFSPLHLVTLENVLFCHCLYIIFYCCLGKSDHYDCGLSRATLFIGLFIVVVPCHSSLRRCVRWTVSHYENMPIQMYWKFYHQKMANFQIKKSDIFHISAQNIDCGYSLEPPRRGGSNKYPHSMFLSRNKKYNVYPCIPQFYYIKVGFKGIKII